MAEPENPHDAESTLIPLAAFTQEREDDISTEVTAAVGTGQLEGIPSSEHGLTPTIAPVVVCTPSNAATDPNIVQRLSEALVPTTQVIGAGVEPTLLATERDETQLLPLPDGPSPHRFWNLSEGCMTTNIDTSQQQGPVF